MSHKSFVALFSLFLIVSVTVVAAQTIDCPTIVQTALQAVDEACSDTGRNQVCYGNVTLDAVPQSGVSGFTFSQAGDMVNVTDVQSLTLSSLDVSSGQWGVALMKIQANVADTLPGQNVTLLLFGDVEIENAVPTLTVEPTATPAPTVTPVLIQVTASQTVNVRSGPSRNEAVIGALPGGQVVRADGQDESGTWLHIHLDDGSVGWVFAEIVTVDGDISLPVLNPDGTSTVASQPTAETPAPTFGPMQAFFFKSGINDRPCDEAPDSGILIQSPEGVARINLTMNGVAVRLGSTIYVQAQASGDMVINVVEGQATATASGATVTAPAGTRLRVPLDANLTASGPPIGPEPYDNATLTALPVTHLPQPITVATALTADQIESVAAILPKDGNWTATATQTLEGCEVWNYYDSVTFGADVDVQVNPRSRRMGMGPRFRADAPEGLIGGIIWPFTGFAINDTTRDSSTGAYIIEYRDDLSVILSERHEIYIISPTRIEGSSITIYRDPAGCVITSTYTMDYVGPS